MKLKRTFELSTRYVYAQNCGIVIKCNVISFPLQLKVYCGLLEKTLIILVKNCLVILCTFIVKMVQFLLKIISNVMKLNLKIHVIVE